MSIAHVVWVGAVLSLYSLSLYSLLSLSHQHAMPANSPNSPDAIAVFCEAFERPLFVTADTQLAVLQYEEALQGLAARIGCIAS